jgi:endogenous inhibitor of DNA gyrase (YacG/DUF329 family)
MELWIAYDMVKSEECPNCGVEPRELMEWEMVHVKCPICKQSHGRVKRWGELRAELRGHEE